MTQATSARDALPVQPARNRLLITLVVDTSSSMADSGGIAELNNALQSWKTELLKDDFVARVGEIALVTFGNNHVQALDPSGRTTGQPTEPYVPVRQFNPPRLEAGGVTPMVEGLQYALGLIGTRKQQLRELGVPLANRPLLYLITDGVPTDSSGHPSDQWRDLAPVIRQQEAGKHLLFFAIGVQGAERDVLSGLAPDSNMYLDSLEFSKVLRLVSASIEMINRTPGSRDQPAEKVYKQFNEQTAKAARMREFLRGGG